MTISIRLIFLCLVSWGIAASPALCQVEFEVRNRVSGGEALWDIVEGGHGLVAVGTGGALLWSADGQEWEARDSGTTDWLVAVAYAQGRYLAVGDNGTLTTSTDGMTWMVMPNTATAQRLNNIAYAGGLWVAVGENGTLISSPDGETWTKHESSVTEWLRGLAWMDLGLSGDDIRASLWVTTGQHGVMLASVDGKSWEQISVPESAPRSFNSEALLPVPSRSFIFGNLGTTYEVFEFLEAGSNGSYHGFKITARYDRLSESLDPTEKELFLSGGNFNSGGNDGVVWRTMASFQDTIVLAGAEGTISVTDWSSQPTAPMELVVDEHFQGSGFGQGSLFVVGDNQTILQSEPIFRSRLVNISTRGFVANESRPLTAGAVVVGESPKALLIRAAGPALADFGVTENLPTPTIRVYGADQNLVAENTDWFKDDEQIWENLVAEWSGRAGAFHFSAGNADSGVAEELSAGIYTATVTGGDQSGIALVEFYDAAEDPLSANSRLTNLSTRGRVGTGDRILIAGFTIQGQSPLRILIRGVAPTLTDFGVTGVLEDPAIKLFDASGLVIATNDNWDSNSDPEDLTGLRPIFAQVGAFALRDESADAALVVTLQPGSYTVHLSGAGDGVGEALVEVYELP